MLLSGADPLQTALIELEDRVTALKLRRHCAVLVEELVGAREMTFEVTFHLFLRRAGQKLLHQGRLRGELSLGNVGLRMAVVDFVRLRREQVVL